MLLRRKCHQQTQNLDVLPLEHHLLHPPRLAGPQGQVTFFFPFLFALPTSIALTQVSILSHLSYSQGT